MVGAPRLENVLKRAEELEAMKKAPAALDALYETVLSKRTRSMPLVQLEPVFEKFVELAVSLRRGKVVKDGLHQYRKLVLTFGDEGVVALVRAVDSLLSQAEARVARAEQEAKEVTVDDLDEEESPQDLLLAMVSSEEAKDRTDREVVTPWLKFLWESYRSVLDVLRNNSQLEVAYASVVDKALTFCQRFGRKMEFRRLADLLRTHLQYAATQSRQHHADVAAARAQAAKQAGTKDVTAAQIAAHMPATAAAHPIDLSDADTLQRFLDMRFEQLNVAVRLELWQEAFRSVEDVHTLLSATRRPIPVGSMATYYETLARVFAVSQNYLFHAATWFRYFAMLASRRAPEAELTRIASFCVLSLLCIPRGDGAAAAAAANSTTASGHKSNRARRWMALINLAHYPTRQALIDAALARRVLEYARPELRTLFELLETQFNPLTLHDALKPVAASLKEHSDEYSLYFGPLRDVAATAVFDGLATTYTEAKTDFVLNLVSLPEPLSAPRAELERLLVRGSGSTPSSHRVRIDHEAGIVRFVDSLSGGLSGSAGSLVRSEVYDLARSLARLPITAGGAAGKGDNASSTRSREFAVEARLWAERHAREAARSEQAEREKLQAEEKQARERSRIAEETRRSAESRAAAEEAERAAAVLAKERAELAMAEKRRLAEQINAKGHMNVDMANLDTVSTQELERMQVEQLDLEAKNLDARMATVVRRYDHLERALRREEAKLWREDAEAQAARDEEAHKRRAEALVNGARRAHELALQYTERLTRVRSEYGKFVDTVRSAHSSHVEVLRTKNKELLEAAKAERRAEVEKRDKEEAAAREADEKRRAEEERQEEERRAREEERLREEERRRDQYYRPPAASAGGASRAASGPAPSRASPFGAARPASASPFGAARAGSPAGAASASARPAAASAAQRSSPFGAASAAQRAPPGGASPFGSARAGAPAGGQGPRSSPFGSARAGSPATGSANNTGAQPEQKTEGAYIPPWKRT